MFCELASLGADDQRLPPDGAALNCVAICTPLLVFFFIAIVGRTFD